MVAWAGVSRKFAATVSLNLVFTRVDRVIEMQAIAAVLLENFEFSVPEQTEKNKIKRKPANLMSPMVDGQRGPWMGLHVKSVN